MPDPTVTRTRPYSAVLTFPPLVELSFGRYFPSTAVLGGYLSSRGIASHQWDLNEEFALHLLEPEHLCAAGEGRLAGIEGDFVADMSGVAGRWLTGNRDRLFDAEGRHAFASVTGPAYLLTALARPYLIDPEPQWLSDPALLDSDRTLVYRTYFADLDLASRLPADAALFGISLPMGPQLVPGLILAREIKRVRPDIKVVLGGPTLSLMDQDLVTTLLNAHRQVDAVVRYDGELPLTALCEQAAPGGTWQPASVAGVSARTEELGVVHAAPGPGLHPNALPHAEYDPRLLDRLVDAELGIVQARGCYWGKCDYCDFVEQYDGSPAYRGRSVKSFVAEIEHQVATHGVRQFELITESIPPAFSRRFSQEVLDRGLDISWSSFAMVDRRFDEETLQLMARAGCAFLVVGMETTNTRVLKLVHKSADREENLRFIRDAHRAGVNLRINLIPDLPSTTLDEAVEALQDVSGLADHVEQFSIFPFEATRSSEVGRNPEKFGLVVAENASGLANQAQYALNHLGNIDPAMTDEERRRVHRMYQDFAIRHGSGHMRETGSEFLSGLPGTDDRFRLAVDHLDLLPRGRELLVTHVVRRERTVLPAAVAAGLAPWLDGSACTLRELAEVYGQTSARAVLAALIESRLLTAVADTMVAA
ncbi:B12-binding domain-containing radical SAM protein [Streptomyces luteogriseus]|uniref:B12-binding domain-containing radical SAM protein n=1 Tax=Streptomyces luteogriseus TaxID=68233 RepID=UPI002633E088|nr:radical SAM protein [uncultured Streptomyces sp.]